MFDDTLITNGFEPMFTLADESIIEIVTLDLQLKLFNKRSQKVNIETQMLESDDARYLLILYIKDKHDNDSLEFVLENLVNGDNLIHADAIKEKK